MTRRDQYLDEREYEVFTVGALLREATAQGDLYEAYWKLHYAYDLVTVEELSYTQIFELLRNCDFFSELFFVSSLQYSCLTQLFNINLRDKSTVSPLLCSTLRPPPLTLFKN